MFPKPESSIPANTAAYETTPLVKPTGFREYDARWLYGSELNLMGAQAIGLGLGTLLHERQVSPEIVIAHDYRSYSSAIKLALATGLMASGCRVHDIGLAVSPMAYFAQFELDVPAVAMVTASHNDNGWTGIKMGADRPLTFGPEEMGHLKEIVLSGIGVEREGGRYHFVPNFAERYIQDLVKTNQLEHPLKVVAACGNGTAGMIAPRVLRAIGCEVIELDCELDYTFPNYNPNPEDLAMLHAVAGAVKRSGADVGLAFDGDGDRCGVIDEKGQEIFADKVGLLLARDLARLYPGSHFVVDVKSTGLFATDPELKRFGASVDYWKTGHSYIKRRVKEEGARAGFEKSGHFFFNTPIGRGYDDGLIAAIAVCEMLDRNHGKPLSVLRSALPQSWQSPTMSPHCSDEVKYDVVERVTAHFSGLADSKQRVANQLVREVNTVNGIRLVLEDGTWGLVRASSNKPELVIVVESPSSEGNMRAIFREIDTFLSTQPEVGAYNQKI